MYNKIARQELANTLTHFAGILIFGAMSPFLILKVIKTDPEKLNYILLFCFGLLMVYSSSTLYHFAKKASIKHKLRIWDHISIYFLIGGSYSPFVAFFLPAPHAQTFLYILWGLIAVGVLFKLFFTGKYDIISTLSYVGLGWMALFIIQPIISNASESVLWLIVAGGLSYTVGVIFYVWKGFTYHHAIWHVFVLAGSIAHFFAVREALKGA